MSLLGSDPQRRIPFLRHLPFLSVAAFALSHAASAAARPPERYLYYLHGKIVEDLGPSGVSPRFGRYDYPGILAAFRGAGLTVISEQRGKDTDPAAYADKLAADIRMRIKAGTPAHAITVVGASKGSVIAMLLSDRLRVPGLRYVFLANCNVWIERTHRPRFSGEVLSIYESSDELAQSCRPMARRSEALRRFKGVRLDTGLGHGIVYRPLPAWIDPAVRWAKR